jgi:Kef-type K+ transport system membrane component KefB
MTAFFIAYQSYGVMPAPSWIPLSGGGTTTPGAEIFKVIIVVIIGAFLLLIFLIWFIWYVVRWFKKPRTH